VTAARLRQTLRVVALLHAMTLAAAAAAVAVPGLAPAVREALDFALVPTAGSVGEMLGILATNARAALFVVAAAWCAGRLRHVRAVGDVLIAGQAALNCIAVGAALGAYGPRALSWLVHLPLEWAALALVLTAYLESRRRPLPATALLAALLAALAVLTVAAAAESFLVPLLVAAALPPA